MPKNPNVDVKDPDKIKDLKVSRKAVIRAGLAIGSVGSVIAAYRGLGNGRVLAFPNDQSSRSTVNDPLFSSAGVQFPGVTSDGSNPGDYFTFFRSDESVHGRMRYWVGGTAYDVINNVAATDFTTITDGVTLDQAASGSKLEVKALGIANAQISNSAAIANSKIVGLANLASNVFSGYPLAPGTDVLSVIPGYKYRLVNASGTYKAFNTLGGTAYSSSDAGTAGTSAIDAAGVTVLLDGIGGIFSVGASTILQSLFNNVQVIGINGTHVQGSASATVQTMSAGSITPTLVTNNLFRDIEIDGNSQASTNIAGLSLIGSFNYADHIYCHDYRASASFGIVIGYATVGSPNHIDYNSIQNCDIVDVTEGAWNANVTASSYLGNRMHNLRITTPNSITKFGCGFQNGATKSLLSKIYVQGASIDGIDLNDSPGSVLSNFTTTACVQGVILTNVSPGSSITNGYIELSTNDGMKISTCKNLSVGNITFLSNGSMTNATFYDLEILGSNSTTGASSFNVFNNLNSLASGANKVLQVFAETGTAANVFNNTIYGGSAQGFTGSPGVVMIGAGSRFGNIQGVNPIASPTPSVATGPTSNIYGTRMNVIVAIGSTATTVTKNATALFTSTAAIPCTVTVTLNPGETITLSQTTGVTWTWWDDGT